MDMEIGKIQSSVCTFESKLEKWINKTYELIWKKTNYTIVPGFDHIAGIQIDELFHSNRNDVWRLIHRVYRYWNQKKLEEWFR